MGGVDGGRKIATGDLVLALGARLDAGQAAFDGELDGLIVAELEVEEANIFQCAPLAAVEGVAADEVQGAGDGRAVAEGHDQGDAVGHGRADPPEEVAGQIGAAPFAGARVLIEVEEGVPVGLLDGGAGQDADVELGLGLAAFAANGLAAIGRQGGEEVVEGLVALVPPDELHVLTPQHPGLAHGQPVRLGREVDVQGRQALLLCELDRTPDQGVADRGGVGVGVGEEAGAGGGGEGHGA